MARYDYRCPKCGLIFEVEHPMGEKPEILCPADGEVCEHVFEPSAIAFTGSGFYNTDQRDSSTKSASHCDSCSGGDCSHCAS
ncbi:FmdB family zinc ribbon protein [Leptogranulimonas caecicola]|uniref:Putative regulatory protein FmdB zinc ribbon domain-containing protein n=1 Tax=Leptogranulimonas caecicola TaxID=2894156 RepID=A0AAU9CDF8_9ACTN|nr:FmdB family zinc ribbon protein [Leptogranulimonas caecicola]BCV18489.1 hypothetical protein ATOBIA_N07790 [Atopobiaceae bacterium P1]BDC90820.1 hypothetical protein ATTO_06920 [Leptogranulimonas caecicola]